MLILGLCAQVQGEEGADFEIQDLQVMQERGFSWLWNRECEEEQICGIPENQNSCFARGSKDNSFELALNWLWWRAENHGFSYALNEKGGLEFGSDPDGGFPGFDIGNFLRLPAQWHSGFRLGLGWNSNYDRWDLFSQWTSYELHSKDTNRRDDLTPNFLGEIADGYYPQWPLTRFTHFETVHASWRLFYNAIDLELGRAYFITSQLSLRPHWGGRGAYIRQTFSEVFEDLITESDRTELLEYTGKNNWWGVGPRIGIQGDWHCGKGVSVIGKTSASLLYGQTKVKVATSDTIVLSNTTEVVTLSRERDVFFELVPTMQLYLGIGWGTSFKRGQTFFGIDVGWEANYWWNQFNLPVDPLPTVFDQPLTLEGLTVNVHWDF